jgi:hypothetical protein
MCANKCVALVGLALLCAVGAAQAQMPQDNPVWQGRCLRLSAHARAIESGAPSPDLVAATRGIPGERFTVIAFDRSQAQQHWVACTMFYLGAIAEAHGNSGKVRLLGAENRVLLGDAERRMAMGQKVPMTESLRRAGVEAHDIVLPTPTPAEVGSAIEAADVLPAEH